MNDQGNPSGLYVVAGQAGAVIGFVAALFLIGPVYGLSADFVFARLVPQFGPTLAEWLTWAVGAAEAYLLYLGSKLLFTFLVIWLLTKVAMRGLR